MSFSSSTTRVSRGRVTWHLIPNVDKQLEVYCRVDGLLRQIAIIPSAASNIVSRLRSGEQRLTDRTDLPQEGRIRNATESVEMRVSTFPTVHGEKAVVRLFAGSQRYLDEQRPRLSF